MLGVVFTEFMEMVEDVFSFDMADKVLEISGVGSDVGFTAVQDYDHTLMVKMVAALSKQTEMPIDDLIQAFGKHLFGRFSITHSHFFNEATSSLDFLENIEDYIHVEVKKLYPNAKLPTFDCIRHSDDCLEMNYRSVRPFGDLAHGLILGAGQHFDETLEVERTDRNGPNEVQFLVRRIGATQ
jgi:hypothetical protein